MHIFIRYLPETRYLNADRIKKMRGPLEERVAQGIKENPTQKFLVEQKRLSIDTPENRFVKHAVQSINQKMGRLIPRMQESKRLSDSVLQK